MSSSLSLLEDSLEDRNLGESVNAYGSIVADNGAMEEDEAVEIEEVWGLPCVHVCFFDRSFRIVFIFTHLLKIGFAQSVTGSNKV